MIATDSGFRCGDRRVRPGRQAVGLTLGEIREVIAFRERGEVPCGHVLDVILHHAAQVDGRIAALQQHEAAESLRPQQRS